MCKDNLLQGKKFTEYFLVNFGSVDVFEASFNENVKTTLINHINQKTLQIM